MQNCGIRLPSFAKATEDRAAELFYISPQRHREQKIVKTKDDVFYIR